MTKFKTLTDLKQALDTDFCRKFFDKGIRAFFGDESYYWSISNQELTITHKIKRMFGDNKSAVRKSYFRPIDIDGKLELTHIRSSGIENE